MSTEWQQSSSPAVGEKAEVANANKTVREQVDGGFFQIVMPQNGRPGPIGTKRWFNGTNLQPGLVDEFSSRFPLATPNTEYDFSTHLAHPCTSRGKGIMVRKLLAVLIVLTTAASLPTAAKNAGPFHR